MSAIKGAREYEKFKRGDKLTRKQAMKALCFECNGLDESASDCQGLSCPIYQYRLYPGKKGSQEPKGVI